MANNVNNNNRPSDDVELTNFTRYSDLDEEPLVVYPSIHVYEHLPLMSLEDAVQPLIMIIPKINEMVQMIKERCRDLKDLLTINEAASIMLFTMDWTTEEESFHRILNRTLRSEDREDLRPWYLYLKLFFKALGKLPSIRTFVYRAVPTDLSQKYFQGKTFIWWSFSLCTRSIDAFDQTTLTTRFQIECKTGKDIRSYFYSSSSNRHDNILLLSAQRYKVISSLESGQNLRIIHVKEIDSTPTTAPVNSERTSSFSLSLSQRRASINISIRETSFCSVVLKLTGSSSIYHNPNLEDLLTLSKSNCCIDLSVRELIDQDIPIIVQRAIIDKQCSSLYLTGNRISYQNLSILTHALYNNQTLRELDLSDNQIVDRGVEILTDFLLGERCVLEKLHLGSNGITDRGANYLSNVLKKNRSLTHLMLNRNSIGNAGVHLLSSVLTIENRSLLVLSLSFNSLISDQSVDSFIVMLKQNSTLKGLDLKCCNISEGNNQRLRRIVQTKERFELFTNPVDTSCSIS